MKTFDHPRHRPRPLPATTLRPTRNWWLAFDEKRVAGIAKMSGIRNRRVVAPGQCASDLAVAAARRLLEEKQVDPATIDLIVFTSQTPDFRTPATAARLQAELGIAERCSAFNMNQACAAFIFTMQVAHSLLVAGMANGHWSSMPMPSRRSSTPWTAGSSRCTATPPWQPGRTLRQRGGGNRIHRDRHRRQGSGKADRARGRRTHAFQAGDPPRKRPTRPDACDRWSSSTWTARQYSISCCAR